MTMCLKLCALVILVHFLTTIQCDQHLLIDQLIHDFLKLEETLWKFVLSEVPTNNQTEARLYLIKNFSVFDQKLIQMPDDILRGLEPVKNTKSFLLLHSELTNTYNMYDKFRNFQNAQKRISPGGFNDSTRITETIHLEDVVRDILNPKTEENGSVTLGIENMVKEASEILEKDFQCKNFFQSAQLLLYNIYNSIALNELKRYIMVQFAYLSRAIEEKGNYTEISHNERTNFEKRVNETQAIFRKIMEISNITIWRCDPVQHSNDMTYVEISRLLQGYVANEADMNVDGTCTKSCNFYKSASSHGCIDSNSAYCRDIERCTGSITECRFVESSMNICPSKNSTRRYDYVEYASGKTMGKKSSCDKKHVDSWNRWFVQCSYCMCLCDEQGPKSDRYFNMRPVMADTDNTMVVTGLRFVKHNRIIHLQIQEGKLLPYGYVDNATVHWVPVDDYKIDDPGVYHGTDYFTMTYENRSLALDDLVVPAFADEQLVTGVRFVFNKMLRLRYYTNSVEWRDGSFLQYSEISRSFPARGNYQIDLGKADVPVNSPSPTEVNYAKEPYVKFTHTDFDADAAQITIPFIDIQPVFADPPVPLRGVGLHFRGQKGYGGFIAPKIFTYDYAFLMTQEFSEEKKQGNERIKVIILSD